MDENTSPVSTPGSENASSLRERFSPLQSKTNKSSYEIKSDGAKKTPSSSPLRSPMSEKNASVFTPPSINRQALKSFPPRSSSPIERQRQQEKLQLHTDRNDGVNDTSVHQLKQQKEPRQSTASPTNHHLHPKIDNNKRQLQLQQLQRQQQQQQQQEQERAMVEETKALQQEIDAGKATLEAQRQHTAKLVTWENSMVELINQFKELRADVDDSVDILVESDQILVELEADYEKQAQVDELMNLIPQRLFEIAQFESQQ